MNYKSICTSLFCFSCAVLFSQVDNATSERLDKFLQEHTTTSYTEIVSDTLSQTLKHKVYSIVMETKGMHNNTGRDLDEFIVIDNGTVAKAFEKNNTNTPMPELTAYLKKDFKLNAETAPVFQGLLDIIYPLQSWKADKKEFLTKNGKWYFLRDKFFQTKQGFEVTVDENENIKSIRYKMRWESEDGK